MHYTVYKTTNLLNGKFYIGKHQTENPNDGYLGSGKALEAAIKRHGRENFKKEILFDFPTQEEMDAKEKKILTEEFIASNQNYNMGVGGEGGPHFKGKKHSEESRKKMGRPGKKLSAEHRKKISEKNRKRVYSEETRQKLAELAKKRWANPEQRKKLLESNNFCTRKGSVEPQKVS